MRARGFRFHSIFAKVSGVLCILVGVVLPFATVRRQPYYFGFSAVARARVIGITLLIVSVIFSREHHIRKKNA